MRRIVFAVFLVGAPVVIWQGAVELMPMLWLAVMYVLVVGALLRSWFAR